MSPIVKIIRILLFAAAIVAVYVFMRPSIEEGKPASIDAIHHIEQEVEDSEPLLMTQQWDNAQEPEPEGRPDQPAKLDKPDKQDETTDDDERGDAILFDIDALSSTPFD